MRSVSEVRVRYAETDQMGVAYHANYLVWCEVGRTDFIRALGVSYAGLEEQGVMLAVADAKVRFHASAKYDDVVRIETTLVAVRSRLVEFHYELFRVAAPGATGGERLATASTALVSLSREGRPLSLPTPFRDLLAAAAGAAD
jgi:acyl-CoA thioester hydrolase